MIKLEHVVLPSAEQTEFIIEGMRNPMNSWNKSDSFVCPEGGCLLEKCVHYVTLDERDENYILCKKTGEFIIGDNDKDLMLRLAKAGTEHRKYMRMMPVFVRITAPLYWWKEFDTYKVGTVANSCSTMHKIAAKEFVLDDFSWEHLLNTGLNLFVEEKEENGLFRRNVQPLELLTDYIIPALNVTREHYLAALKTEEETGLPAKDIWWQMIQLLPSSYNQTRNVMLNYEVLSNIYRQRKNHKLDEWREFCKWIEEIPYSELIIGELNIEKGE